MKHPNLILVGAMLAFSQPTFAQTSQWTGSDFWALPLHDWSRQEGQLVVEPGKFGGEVVGLPDNRGWSRLHHATATLGRTGSFTTSFQLKLERRPSTTRGKSQTGAGIWFGLQSRTPSPRNVWIHPEGPRVFAGLSRTGKFQLANTFSSFTPDPTQPMKIEIRGRISKDGDFLEARIRQGQNPEQRLEAKLPGESLTGGLCLVASGSGSLWNLGSWDLSGPALVHHPEQAAGPILWSQYTLQDDGRLKLQAQMVPLEASDPQNATLEIPQGNDWIAVANSSLEPASSTFLFRVEDWDISQSRTYRVRYEHPTGTATWQGVIRSSGKDRDDFRLSVSNCDHGELFPQDTLVGNVGTLDPDMMFFAGDQIYENMDQVRIVRKPAEGARLSYLNKWYQFGLTWRQLLKDRPSVILPDDHDVFMGNVWGDSGAGYAMPPDWVNLIQRTQTGHLPDPVDPEPLANGIEVYFTELRASGMSFAIIEDRKFKTDPKRLQVGKARTGAEADAPEASLLGKRQVNFLRDWTRRTSDLPVRFFLSQTMFAKATTHSGSNLKRSTKDFDSNGWPQTARNRALEVLGRDTIMVHGDQHLGVLARMGIREWDDGPLAFMVTGSSVGFPRAWWPDKQPKDGLLHGNPFSGRYLDDMGNRITIHGVTNPAPLPEGVTDARNRPDYRDQGVFAVQHAKGSGFGMVVVDKRRREATFEAYRLNIDLRKPAAGDQFEGFPITLPLR